MIKDFAWFVIGLGLLLVVLIRTSDSEIAQLEAGAEATASAHELNWAMASLATGKHRDPVVETKRYKAVFNTLGKVPYRKPSTLVASIASESLPLAIATVAQGTGKARTVDAKFTGYVRARLTGPSEFVTIDSDGSDVKYVGPSGNATWRWAVVPKTMASTKLTLSFFNLVERGGQLVEAPGPTYFTTVTVKPTIKSYTQDTIREWDGLLQYVIPILASIFGFAIGRRFERRADRHPTAAPVAEIKKPAARKKK